jgi:hypothetical protein
MGEYSPKFFVKNQTENKLTGIFTKSLGIFHRLGVKGWVYDTRFWISGFFQESVFLGCAPDRVSHWGHFIFFKNSLRYLKVKIDH